MVAINDSTKRIQAAEHAKAEILALLVQLKQCTQSCSPDCEGARTRGVRIAEKAPPKKTKIKIPKAPSDHEQKMIAQAHWWEIMRRRDPRLNLPVIEVPTTDWVPTGQKQINAYNRHFRTVFDDFWWEMADVGTSDLGSDSEMAARIADAAAPAIFWEMQNHGIVESIVRRIASGKLAFPADTIFFPGEKRSNPGKRASKPKKKSGE
jgi:hypothetical protein